MNPRISILLPAMRGYETALTAVDSWEGQTSRNRLEILILCPDHLGPTAAQRAALRPGQVIVPIGSASLHEARAIGVAHASGDYVMLAEDHCLPDPGWTQAIVDRLEEDWDGVGAALRPGNRTSRWAEASFLIGYGEWMIPVTGGPTNVLCGLNGTIRTQLLRAFGTTLADELLIGAFLTRHLRQQGRRFYLEDRATMRHFDPASLAIALSSLTALGLGFGAKRTMRWPLPARLLYPLAAPGIALLHGKRALTHYFRARAGSGLGTSAPVVALMLAVAWAFGEAVGALMGTARVEPHIWRAETRPVSRVDEARSSDYERDARRGRA